MVFSFSFSHHDIKETNAILSNIVQEFCDMLTFICEKKPPQSQYFIFQCVLCRSNVIHGFLHKLPEDCVVIVDHSHKHLAAYRIGITRSPVGVSY